MVESAVSSEELAAIAEEAYLFSFPMLMGYRACFGAFLVPSLPSYSGPMNEIHGDPVTLDHNYKDVILSFPPLAGHVGHAAGLALW